MNEFQPASSSARSEQASIQVQRILYKLPRRPLWRLVEGSDGACYIARFHTSSESRRRRINHWIDSYFLQQLGVSTTAVQILQVPQDILENDPDWAFLISSQPEGKQPLLCLGSRYPAHPDKAASFGFIPRKLWGKIVNPGDLATTFVLDQLLGMNRYRDILFPRDRPSHPHLFKGYFVDNGDIMGGSRWTIETRLNLQSYCLPHAYPIVTPAQWLEALEAVGSQLLPDCQAALSGLPESWLRTDERSEMERLFDQLHNRQQTLSEWIQIPSRCLHFPARDVLQSALKPAASVTFSPALSPA